MPELPEVETTIAGLRPVLEGAIISAVDVRRADLRRPFPPDLRQRLTGATITSLSRRAKYGIMSTSRGDAMIFHLGMSGRWHFSAAPPGLHDHLIIRTQRGGQVTLNDPRRFGSVDLVAGDPDVMFAPFRSLGPEPLSNAFDAAYLRCALAGKATPIKLALLDQRLVAGLGNIYVCEALHMAGISPQRRAGGIGAARVAALVSAIKAVLTSAIDAGGSTLRDFRAPDGGLGYFANDWRVYGRAGELCSCGKAIRRIVQGGRSTFFCACQR